MTWRWCVTFSVLIYNEATKRKEKVSGGKYAFSTRTNQRTTIAVEAIEKEWRNDVNGLKRKVSTLHGI